MVRDIWEKLDEPLKLAGNPTLKKILHFLGKDTWYIFSCKDRRCLSHIMLEYSPFGGIY